MLSRFDLTFVLLDRPDELLDQALSEHVMALHSGANASRGCARPGWARRRGAIACARVGRDQAG